jgi:hypothetical protein
MSWGIKRAGSRKVRKGARKGHKELRDGPN